MKSFWVIVEYIIALIIGIAIIVFGFILKEYIVIIVGVIIMVAFSNILYYVLKDINEKPKGKY